MKKLFLTSLLILLANSSVFAASVDKTGKFYLKGIVGSGRINDIQENEYAKQKSENSLLLGFGAGHYLTDRIRTEITFDRIMLNFKGYDNISDSRNMNINLKRMYINSVMLNAYVDLLKLDKSAVFAGAGIGFAQINEESAWTFPMGNQTLKGSVIKKTANNFACSLSVGGSLEIRDNLTVDLAYALRNFGKTTRAERPNLKQTLLPKKVVRQDITFSIRMDV